ncbi:MAG: hypothetical protein KBB35_01975 [Bacteroidales bacterium]|jgi:hypothetical protein|nr:hypothetical protein [Bacteroidales bacterium]HKM12047.1 hypothetical protein [Bacteroidales bacterium]HPY22024.1 hypothetical protein [Bacteroidales bacterium]HQA93009.1 hypothetical protein [Bacteroidales bacterium]HQN24104.1 hypothetical protein [Bacteroidales bacterium]
MKAIKTIIFCFATILATASCGSKSTKIIMSAEDCEYSVEVFSWGGVDDFLEIVPGTYVINKVKDALVLNVNVMITKAEDLSLYYCEELSCTLGIDIDHPLKVNDNDVVFHATDRLSSYKAISKAKVGDRIELTFQIIGDKKTINTIKKSITSTTKIYGIILDLEEI